MIRVLFVFFAFTSLVRAAGGFGVGAFPLSSTVVSMWLLGGAETDESRPIVLVYFTGPPEWHRRHWESKFDGSVREDAPVTYKLASASVTLEIAVSADRKRFWVQGNEFQADQTNVFVVKNVNDPKQQRIEQVGHLTLPSNTAEPLSVVVLRDNPPLKSLLE